MTAAEAGELAGAAGAEILVLTHMWEELGLAAYRAQAESRLPGPDRDGEAGFDALLVRPLRQELNLLSWL